MGGPNRLSDKNPAKTHMFTNSCSVPIKEKYSKEVARYAAEQGEIEGEAKAAEDEVAIERRRADRFDLGEVMLEAGLVICSITLMTRKRIFWQSGGVLGLVGLGIAAAGFLIH